MSKKDRKTGRRVEWLFRVWSSFYDHPLLQRLFYGRVHQLLLAEISHVSPEAILDAGCGTGQLLRELGRRFPATRFIGIDLSAAMLAKARNKTYPGDHPVELIEGSVYQIPLQDASVGVITNTISSHSYLDFEAPLSEFYRARPDRQG